MHVCFPLFHGLLLSTLHSRDGTPASEGRFERGLTGLLKHGRVLPKGRLADDDAATERLI